MSFFTYGKIILMITLLIIGWQCLLLHADEISANPQHIIDSNVPLGALASRADNVRGNYLHIAQNGALEGEGVVIAVSDWLSKHIDLKDRFINEATGEDYGHGSLVSGMIAGEGILRPTFKGIAPKSKIISAPSRIAGSHLAGLVNNHNVVLTVKPSGGPISCTSGTPYPYGTYIRQSMDYDTDMRTYPQVLHLTSAGNQGSTLCTPDKYHSIAAGAQSAKNVLTVGAVDINDIPYGNTSRGPTADGRLKPEIVAIGTGFYTTHSNHDYNGGSGTSFSAPQAAGGLALLYEHYRNMHSGANPDAALMKAIFCNTSEDLGNPGPDFHYGYGKMNIRRAKELMDQSEYYFYNELNTTGASFQADIAAPENLHELRVMLYWNDEPGNQHLADTAAVLVNDLDIKIIDENGNIYYPFKLNPNDVTANATTGKDRLNNMEQIIIPAPASGNYTVQVDAFKLNGTAAQDFYVVYELLHPGIIITSPLPEEILPGGSSNYYVEWDYYGNDMTDFMLSYSLDNGVNWLQLATVPHDKRIFKWLRNDLANINISNALFSICKTSGLHCDTVSTPFKIYDALQKTQIQIAAICDNPNDSQLKISWEDICPDCDYEISMYDEASNAMLPVMTTPNNEYIMNYDYTYGETWAAVTVLYPDGGRSLRSNAVRFIPNYVDVKVFLEGALDSINNQMHTKLYEGNFLPRQLNTIIVEDEVVYNAAFVYAQAPFNYDGNEVMHWKNQEYKPNTVDWVLVSLRSTTAPESEFAKTVALLLDDGGVKIIEHDFLSGAPDSSFYLVVEHRNHLSVMTPYPITYDSCNGIIWDFTTRDSWKVSTVVGQKEVRPSVFAMFAGNVPKAGDEWSDIMGADKTQWSLNNGRSAYLLTDFNLDGDINGADKILWDENNGLSSGVLNW